MDHGTHTPNNINTMAWWDEYFSDGIWASNQGEMQTLFFAHIMNDSLPSYVREYLLNNSFSIGDIGCAYGAATHFLSSIFPKSSVEGIDFSKKAVETAKDNYANIEFLQGDITALPKEYDILYCSNVLEHFEYPDKILSAMMKNCRNLAIIMVPYEEYPLSEYHSYSFDDHFFSRSFDGFSLIYKSIIDTSSMVESFWPGKQALAIYLRKGIAISLKEEIMDSNIPTSDTWDEVANMYYNSVIDDGEMELAKEIAAELQKNGIMPDSKILELGCGSGHLSASLAMLGYKTSLLDFSKTSLDIAKQTYDRYNLTAEFIEGDLMNLDFLIDNDYDLVWNSGVMEHFSDNRMLEVFTSIGKIAHKSIFILVPNPLSISYLLMRYVRQSHGDWPYGIEYLRTDYPVALEAIGFPAPIVSYLGIASTKYNFSIAMYNATYRSAFDSLLDRGHLPEREKYITAYFSKRHDENISHRGKIEFSSNDFNGDLPTEKFDKDAALYGLEQKITAANNKTLELEKLASQQKAWLADIEKQNEELKQYQQDSSVWLEDYKKQNEELRQFQQDASMWLEDYKKQIQELEQYHQDATGWLNDLTKQNEEQKALIEELESKYKDQIKVNESSSLALLEKENVIREAVQKLNTLIDAKTRWGFLTKSLRNQQLLEIRNTLEIHASSDK